MDARQDEKAPEPAGPEQKQGATDKHWWESDPKATEERGEAKGLFSGAPEAPKEKGHEPGQGQPAAGQPDKAEVKADEPGVPKGEAKGLATPDKPVEAKAEVQSGRGAAYAPLPGEQMEHGQAGESKAVTASEKSAGGLTVLDALYGKEEGRAERVEARMDAREKGDLDKAVAAEKSPDKAIEKSPDRAVDPAKNRGAGMSM